MPRQPTVSGTDVIKALKRLGFEVQRQRGSHVVMRCDSRGCVVPNHREVKTGTLIGILKQADVSREEFMKALDA